MTLKQMQAFSAFLVMLLQILSATQTLAVFPKSLTKINKKLLVGEWSPLGKCSSERFIYKSNGQYMWLSKVGRNWKTQYSGIYLIKDGLVRVAEEYNMGADSIKVHSLTNTTYKGEWIPTEELTFKNPKDAKFSYTKCPSR